MTGEVMELGPDGLVTRVIANYSAQGRPRAS
jgi:hypothetical protein